MARVADPLILVAVATSPGCGDSPDPFGDTDGVLTLEHFVAAGHRRALEFAGADRDLRGLYAAVKGAVVRVQLQYDSKDPGRVTTDHGSGVIVGDGRYVATAGHVVDAIDRGRSARASVVLADGRVLPAVVVAWRDEMERGQRRDWALLRLVDPPASLTSLEFGVARPGMRALLLGYPSRIGITPGGEARIDDVQSPRALAPVACVVLVEQTVAENVRPVAGATPTDGISGGPLIDPGRRIVGIQHRTTTHYESDASWTTYDCDDAGDLQQLLMTELGR